MKDPAAMMLVILACIAGALPQTLAGATGENPLQKVLELLTSLTAKVHESGEQAAAEYKEYFEWCDDSARSTRNMISTASSREGKLDAKISSLSSDIEASTSKIEDLASAIASSTADLSRATDVRNKEAGDFAASEKELVHIIGQLDRAVAAIEQEAQKSPAAFNQLGNANVKDLLQSLSVVVDAAGLGGSDRHSLLELAQAASSADEDAGAREALSGKPSSAGILDALEDLKAKAEAQLQSLRSSEAAARHNYELLRQSLEDQLSTDNKDLAEEKAAKAEDEEGKAAAEGDKELALKKLLGAKDSLQSLRTACMQTAADHEASIKARDEELAALAKAIGMLKSTTSGAVSQTYSFLQLGSRSSGDRAVSLLRRLAREHHSTALAQLASRAAAVLQYGGKNGDDPFEKVKVLIQSLIESLKGEAESEATEKAFCDEEMAKTEAKKGDLDDDVSKLSVKIDQASAKSADLKEEIRELMLELAELTRLQAHMDKMRQETHAEHVVAKADLELGVNGVRKALGVLREYYSADESGSASLLEEGSGLASLMRQPAIPKQHTKSSGAGSSIIGILEVIEQDFATGLAKEETQEEDAQTEYEQLTQENKVAKTVKEKDVEYKSQQIKQLSQGLAELTADHASRSTEAAAVEEYYEKLKERCIAKPETYQKRKERRDAEIEGLKAALDALDGEASLMQRKRRGHIRGSLSAR